MKRIARFVVLAPLLGLYLIFLPFLALDARAWLRKKRQRNTGEERLVGRQAIVDRISDAGWAHLRLGDDWRLGETADGVPLAGGDRVEVVGAQGAILIVRPI
ncbi:MAG: hypothetical protein JJ899_00760 [Alphaproteobacteria bacterium]|nr:hypothetical protein [Alphaproteobacteria bacterium]